MAGICAFPPKAVGTVPKPWTRRQSSRATFQLSSKARVRTSARRPCPPNNLLAPTVRRRVRRSVHAALGARSRRSGHPSVNIFEPRLFERLAHLVHVKTQHGRSELGALVALAGLACRR